MKKNRVGKTNLRISEIGLGCSGFGNLYSEIDLLETKEIINTAYNNGIKYFDTAPHYGAGLSERRLGVDISDLPREDIVISTKVGRLLKPNDPKNLSPITADGFVNAAPFNRVLDYTYDGIMRSVEDSLQRLGVNKINILNIHDVGKETLGNEYNQHFKDAMSSGFKALDELKSAGVVDAIGLGCNEWQIMEETFKYADFDVFMLAGRYTLLEQSPIERFFPECLKRDISIIDVGIFNSGIIATGPTENAMYNYAPASDEIKNKVAKIYKICEAFGVNPIAAAIQFPHFHPAICSTAIGVRKAKNLKADLELFNVKIPHEFWVELIEQDLIHPLSPIK